MDIAGWNQRYLDDRDQPIGPPAMLVRTTALALTPGTALDIAAGSGRNAIWLAQQGWKVTAVEGAVAALETLRAHANGLAVTAIRADVEAHEYTIVPNTWDLIVIAYYLQRDLIESAKQGVKPGGTLIIIVHITAAGEEPTAHRLRPGELRRLYFSGDDGWEVLHEYEGYPHDPSHRRGVAEIVARKPG